MGFVNAGHTLRRPLLSSDIQDPLPNREDPRCPSCFLRVRAFPRQLLRRKAPYDSFRCSWANRGSWPIRSNCFDESFRKRARVKRENQRVIVRSSSPFSSFKEATKSRKTQETARGRFLNPGRALQLYEEIDDPANRYFNYDAKKTPEVARAQVSGGEATIYLSSQAAAQAARVSARFVWSKRAPDHINPAAPEGSKGRLYRPITKVSFQSKKYVARLGAWFSGSRARESGEPKLILGSYLN